MFQTQSAYHALHPTVYSVQQTPQYVQHACKVMELPPEIYVNLALTPTVYNAHTTNILVCDAPSNTDWMLQMYVLHACLLAVKDVMLIRIHVRSVYLDLERQRLEIAVHVLLFVFLARKYLRSVMYVNLHPELMHQVHVQTVLSAAKHVFKPTTQCVWHVVRLII